MKGHVRKRTLKNGKVRWVAVVDIGKDLEGKRKQQWSTFETRKEADAFIRDTIGRVETGSYVGPSKQTVGQWMMTWLDSIALSVRPTTAVTYRMLAESHIIPRIGMKPLQALRSSDLDRLYSELSLGGRLSGEKGSPLSPRTVRYVHVTIHRALADAVRRKEIARNVADDASPPKLARATDRRTWTATELRAFLEHVAGERLEAAYVVAANTGLRRGEVLGLRWRDVDLDAARLAISNTVVTVNYAVQFSTPKTARGRRSVALDPMTVAALRAHRIRQANERQQLGLFLPGAEDLLFSAVEGGPLHPAALSHQFARLAKRAGLPAIRFHDLRHTHATLALQAGIPAKVVSDRLGHSSVSITLDVYSHVIPGLQEDAAAKVAALVYGAS